MGIFITSCYRLSALDRRQCDSDPNTKLFPWRPILLALAFVAPSNGADARHIARPLCDLAIADYDDALSKDPELGALKSRVDSTWLRLARHGDPDFRAAARDARFDWLCEVKTRCGPDPAQARDCVSDALQRREGVNEHLLRQRGETP
jgi:hypothetical protein